MKKMTTLMALTALTAVAACQREVILPGPRYDARSIYEGSEFQVTPTTAAAVPLSLPAQRGNAEWTNRAGAPDHNPGHVALGAGTNLVFAAPIGQGEGRRHRITADPVVGGGMVYTLDSRATVTATAANGGTVWSTDTRPAGERGDSVSGGGVAYDGGRVFATTGWGELVALDAASGRVLWRQRTDAPIGGAPTAANGVVYVLSRNGIGWAVRASDGKVLWQTFGESSPFGVMGVSAPAVSGDQVIFPFATGRLVAANRETGVEGWSGTAAGTRTGRAIAYIRDVTGDPVVSGNMVIAGTSSGKTYAFDRETGVTLWNSDEGAMNPVVAAGNAVFLISDENRLVRLDAASGRTVWASEMPLFVDQRVKKQDRIVAHYGPVLAGGRLYVASSDGVMRIYDPALGNLVGQAAIPGGAASGPVVAGQTLYVVSRNGQLLAFR